MAKPLTARERLILAVDTSTADEARRIVDELYDHVGIFKVGLELFTSAGISVLSIFQERDVKVFLDLKLMDIPNTVAKASEAVVRHGVAMFTVHASGGGKMLEACAKATNEAAQREGQTPPIILGVTVLTSLDETALTKELSVSCSVSDQVNRLAALCQASGITGIVASAEEAKQLRTNLGSSMILVTPGVRPSGSAANDQSRVVTPAQALKNGSDYLVIGRPITAAADRRDAAKRIIDEMESALA